MAYLESLSHPDGGYSWHGQTWPHLTPTYSVIGCYRAIQEPLPKKARVAEFVRNHHPMQLKKLEQEHRDFDFQQIQSLVWLGEEVSPFRDRVRSWTKPTVYLKQYEQHGWPVFRHEMAAFRCRALLGLPLDDLTASYIPYLESRRRKNGSFNSTPESDGGDGHLLNTLWGLHALKLLDRLNESKNDTIGWVNACQLPGGGFTWQPKPEFAGNDDIAYTWAAIHALDLLGSRPEQLEACTRYILSLRNADGGYGDRPGWLSNPVATYYAVDALNTLGLIDKSSEGERPRPLPRARPLPPGLKVYSIQIEAHGQGSPTEAVYLAQCLGIHLWGAKNAAPKWVRTAQAIADRQGVPVRFFVANEEHGTWVKVAGLGTYSHTSDIMAGADAAIGDPLAGVASWSEYRGKRLASLLQNEGRLVWQFGENEELVRLFLDDSLERGGYSAISTYHFSNPDFTNSEQFLLRYRGHLPFVALQDAHGEEPWWFADMTTGFRTLFLAAEPGWKAWLKALENNWVAAVRRDAVSRDRLWMHGSPQVLELIRQQEKCWRWWDNDVIRRPLISIVAVRPEDEFEAGRPETGIALRIRCAWENTTQGLPKTPLVELVKLELKGVELSPELVKVRGPGRNTLRDHYYRALIAHPGKGEHHVTAHFRVASTQEVFRHSLKFIV